MPPGVTLAAELVDEADNFSPRSMSAAIFKKGREFRVREADLVPDTITGRA